MEQLKRIARAVRAWPPLNVPLTTALRATLADAPFLRTHLPRAGTVKVALPNGADLVLWSRADDWIATQLFWGGWSAFEPETTPVFYRLATSARVTLDVGAYVGFYSLLAAKANATARAHAFEPHPAIFARLRANVLRNQARVLCVPKAVGSTPGTAPFFHVPEGLPSSSSLSAAFMRPGRAEIVETVVPVVTIDDYVRDADVGTVDLVKIDTETTEPDVLAGMRGVLERDGPTIFCEVLAGHGVERRIDALLLPLGYAVYRMEANGPVAGTSVDDLQRRSGTGANYVFARRPEDIDRLGSGGG